MYITESLSDLLHSIWQRRRNVIWHPLYAESKKKWYKWAYLQNRKRLTDWENKLMVASRGRMRGKAGREFGMDMNTLVYLKWVTNKDLLCSTGNSAQRYVAAWMGGEFGGESSHVCAWLSPFAVCLKLSQHCNQLCCCRCRVASVVSDSVRPHRRQPIRLPRPWDSPGKNTGVGCYVLLQCMKVKSESEVAQSCPTFSDPMDCSPPGSSVHGILQARVLEWGAIAFSNQLYSSIK